MRTEDLAREAVEIQTREGGEIRPTYIASIPNDDPFERRAMFYKLGIRVGLPIRIVDRSEAVPNNRLVVMTDTPQTQSQLRELYKLVSGEFVGSYPHGYIFFRLISAIDMGDSYQLARGFMPNHPEISWMLDEFSLSDAFGQVTERMDSIVWPPDLNMGKRLFMRAHIRRLSDDWMRTPISKIIPQALYELFEKEGVKPVEPEELEKLVRSGYSSAIVNFSEYVEQLHGDERLDRKATHLFSRS